MVSNSADYVKQRRNFKLVSVFFGKIRGKNKKKRIFLIKTDKNLKNLLKKFFNMV